MMLISRGSEPSDESDFVTAVYRQTMECRAEHHCNALPFGGSQLLAGLAGEMGCERILELGCALGYSTLWLAHGAPRARIDVVESDPVHVQKAAANFARYGIADRVMIHEGDFADVLPSLEAGYDLVLHDGGDPHQRFAPELERLVRKGGVLLTANLLPGAYAPLLTDAWRSVPAGGNVLMSVRS